MFNSIKKGLSIALAGVLAVSTISVSSYETQAAEVGEYNYAKLLQESLYFYDANMCGKDVGERTVTRLIRLLSMVRQSMLVVDSMMPEIMVSLVCHRLTQQLCWEYPIMNIRMHIPMPVHQSI